MSEQIFKRLYSVREAARYLGVSQWAVRHLNWSSKLPCVRQGRRVLFDIYDMDRFIENNKQGGNHGHDLSSQETRPDHGDLGRTGPVLDEILH
ncbi:MAG: helix-turn-helix domain-containing protein [Nitrosomonas ureae]